MAETLTSRVPCFSDSGRPATADPLVSGKCSLQSHEDPALGS